MRFLDLVLGAAAVSTSLAAPAAGEAKRKRASKFEYVGVNESGAEFGNTALPGRLDKDYTWPVHSSIDVRIASPPGDRELPLVGISREDMEG